MKVSEVNLQFVKDYLRQDSHCDDLLIEALLQSAKAEVMNYTGISPDELEDHEDLVIPILVLVAEFYDNRTVSINDKLNLRVNEMLTSLLHRHSINLI